MKGHRCLLWAVLAIGACGGRAHRSAPVTTAPVTSPAPSHLAPMTSKAFEEAARAAQNEAGTHEEDHGEGDLGDDQGAAGRPEL